VRYGDPQYLVLFDENDRPLCTCTSEENRDALIAAINGEHAPSSSTESEFDA
jgi:hypothetical protein